MKPKSVTVKAILVGTVAVETSEYLSELLHQAKVPHEVLNAKNHFKEAKLLQRWSKGR